MPSVLLGNPRPIGALPGHEGEHVTEVDVPDSRSLDDAIRDVCHDEPSGNTGLWRAHSDASSPSWVESSSAELAAALAARFGCPVGRPTA